MEASQLTVRTAREDKGLSQQELAVKAKCSISTVRNAEKWPPSDATQKAIARALGVPREALWPN